MSNRTPVDAAQILSACRENCSAIGDALNRCFDIRYRLTAGEMLPYDGASPDPTLNGPGLVVAVSVGGDVLLCLVPASLPLPVWYAEPDAGQADRLQGLAREWSLSCLPDDVSANSCVTHAVDGLWGTIEDCRPHSTAAWLPLPIAPEPGTPPGNSATQTIWILWAVAELPLPSANSTGIRPESADSTDVDEFAADNDRFDDDPSAWEDASPAPPRINRLLKVPVPIIVKLAEKKIELGQLLQIGPGAIVTFEKSCEDLLDLHVNNMLYCRGEAVKIGEKFGLKINEVGSIKERVSALLGPGP